MRLSYFTQPVHPPAKAYRQVLHEDREVILLADELDYVESFLGKHITDRNDKMLQSIDMMLAIRAGEPTCNLTDDYWTMSTERTLNEALVETAAAE
ncbi:MAG: LLM class flavin-dependent oxidoreductase [Pseudomonadota bacterium]|nr:LLM class flavin-dependent oxidoreductase [Pseudomonadota bacterium]